MGEDVLIPMVVFGSLAAIVISAFYFSYKKRTVVYDAIKVAIEKTGTVDAALVEAIIRDNVGPYADLRKGIILIAVAAAFMILGVFVDDQEAVGPMIGVASFPGLVGLAYVAFHFFAPREPTV
ncbi:DUF6249 domain-containing protein [Hyphococcus sp.]|jgi:hypothetical protein|uniref:DUF6249 domain-containing protein n=1 Tax=Hyphococcus sp. TaxID=2038636 RepID=UPI003D102882